MTYASFYAVSQDSWDDYRRKMKEARPVNDAGLETLWRYFKKQLLNP
jgi:hypothetical protein